MKTPLRIFSNYRKWRKNWDDLCNFCGQCCYPRSRSSTGDVVVDFSKPCEFLDTETHLCRVFESRFSKNDHCGNLSLYHALFNPLLPLNCAYVQTFRL